MTRTQITVVEDSFSIEERGTVATGIWHDESQRLYVGDQVEIVRPDSSKVRVSIDGIDLFPKCFGKSRNIGLLLRSVKEKAEIPKGSEVWLLGIQKD